jgi:hypothetical protein
VWRSSAPTPTCYPHTEGGGLSSDEAMKGGGRVLRRCDVAPCRSACPRPSPQLPVSAAAVSGAEGDSGRSGSTASACRIACSAASRSRRAVVSSWLATTSRRAADANFSSASRRSSAAFSRCAARRRFGVPTNATTSQMDRTMPATTAIHTQKLILRSPAAVAESAQSKNDENDDQDE